MQAARPAYHHGDLRRTLVKEGLRLVEKGGVSKLTLASLAAHCGVSTPALYHHFRDKDALMTELGLAALARFEAAIEGALGTADTGIDLGAFARAYVTFAMAHPELYDLTCGRATWQRPTRGPLHTRAKSSFSAFVARLKGEQERGRLARGEDPLRLAQVAWATLHGLATIAFPSISTGIYGYPIEAAAEVAVATVRDAAGNHANIREVTFCCFSANDLAVYDRVLGSAH